MWSAPFPFAAAIVMVDWRAPERSAKTAMKIAACTVAAFLTALTASVSPARAASFDCAKAATPVEKAICGNTNLSNLDKYLGGYYYAARQELGDGATCLRDDQRHWIRATRNPCGSDVACLTKVYLKRLAVLDGLQPGVTQLRVIKLPPEPELVDAVPPEPETKSSGNGGVLSIRGHLVWEEKDIHNGGYAVRSADGHAHAIVFGIDIGNDAPDILLESLVKVQRNETYLVRGYKAKFGAFAQDRCRFIYWLPEQPRRN